MLEQAMIRDSGRVGRINSSHTTGAIHSLAIVCNFNYISQWFLIIYEKKKKDPEFPFSNYPEAQYLAQIEHSST